MRKTWLAFAVCAVAAFGLAGWLEPWFQSWAGNRADSSNLLQVALGDSRRLFAKHFYVKADAYFHSGYYPTIYDTRPDQDKLHMATGTTAGHDQHEEGPEWMGKPRDWIDRFSRHFYPTRHRHLGEEAAPSRLVHPPGEADTHDVPGGGEERELLPWLRLSASLDPERPETYLVASFWLRSRLGRVNEAEQFLREGLRHNPGDYEMLFELGRIQLENRKSPERARNVWELALHNWRKKNAGQSTPDNLVYAQILGQLATLEETEKNYARAAEYLEALLAISPHKTTVQKWLDDTRAKTGP
jgi:tetratricopeptide (TPR) repeat protein